MVTIVRLLKLMAPFRWWILAGVLLSFATTGASVGLMAVSAYLISKAALVTDTADLNVIITGVRFFAISRAALRYAERYVTHLATFRILTRLRVWFYRAIEPLAPARLMQYRSGDLLTRTIADIETLENFYLRVVIPPLAAVLVTILGCLILGSFDVWLALALLAFIVLTGVVLPLASRWLSRQPAAELIATRAELNASLVDEVQGIADLLAYGQEDVVPGQGAQPEPATQPAARAVGGDPRHGQRSGGAVHQPRRADRAVHGDSVGHHRPDRWRLSGAAAVDRHRQLRGSAAAGPRAANAGVEPGGGQAHFRADRQQAGGATLSILSRLHHRTSKPAGPSPSRCATCIFATRRMSRRCWTASASAYLPAVAWRWSDLTARVNQRW